MARVKAPDDRALSALLALLAVAIFILNPLTELRVLGQVGVEATMGVLLLATGALADHRKAIGWPVLAAGVLAALGWIPGLNQMELLMDSRCLVVALFYGWVAYVVLLGVMRAGPVTRARIEGAVAVYLVVGLLFSSLYEFMIRLAPGSIHFPEALNETSFRAQCVYYSFVTLTTLGYGDVVPCHPVTHTLAILEALLGQLYPAILIARLVSLSISPQGADE